MGVRLPFRVWLLLVLLGVGGVLALLDRDDSGRPGPVPHDEAGEPDYYLEGVRLTRFDDQGLAHQRLQTPRLVHTPKNDVTRLEAPTARLVDASGRTWHASAASGVLGPGGNPLTLSGDARLRAPAENWQLATQRLHYDAERRHAWSDTPVVLRQPPQRMEAERFDAWLDDNRLRLTDNVRGYHPPATRRPIDEDSES